MVFLAMGPWHHGQAIEDGTAMGDINFGADTALQFRMDVLAPFLAHYLKDEAPPLTIAPVTAFETGTDHWTKLKSWPSGCEAGCAPKASNLYLQPGGKLGLRGRARPPRRGRASSPTPPIPFPSAARPIKATLATARPPTGPTGWWTTSVRRRAAPTC